MAKLKAATRDRIPGFVLGEPLAVVVPLQLAKEGEQVGLEEFQVKHAPAYRKEPVRLSI